MHPEQVLYFVFAGLLGGLLTTAGCFQGWTPAGKRSQPLGGVSLSGEPEPVWRGTAEGKDSTGRGSISANLGKLPLYFVENRGSWTGA